MNTVSSLNNREIATAIWLTIIFLWALSIGSVRRSILQILKMFFNKKILALFAVMLTYIFFMVKVFEKIGFWDVSATKDTVLWVAGSALATFFNLNKTSEDENYFKNVIVDNLKLVLILEFIFNLYSFNLVVELIMIPIISVIAVINVYAGSKQEYKQIKVFLDYVLGFLGLLIFAFTFREFVNDFQNFFALKNLRDFLLPPLFTILFLPLAYLMALYMQYEQLFVRVDFANKNSNLARYTKRKIFTACHFNLSRLNKFSRNAGSPRVNNKDDVATLIEKANDK